MIPLGMVQQAILKTLYDEGPQLLASIREFYREKAGGHQEYPKTMACVKLFVAHDLVTHHMMGPDRGIKITERGKALVEKWREEQRKLYIPDVQG